jgi:hypothetical protein
VTISPDKAHDRAVKAADGLRRSFLDQAGGDRELAARLRSEHFSELGRRSGDKRRAQAAKRRADELAALRAAGVEFATEAELLKAARQLVRR